jgi:hypothetical protein
MTLTLAAAWASAAEPAAVEQPGAEQYGLDAQSTTIGVGGFYPLSSSLVHEHLGNGYVYANGPVDGDWVAQIGPSTGIPVGARVTEVCAYVYDNSGTGEVTLVVGAFELGSASDDPAFRSLGQAATGAGATPDYTAICVQPASLTVRTFADHAGDATPFYGYPAITLAVTGPTPNLAFGGAVVWWNRQLSPAPGTASFGDVPLGYWAFQHVEALVDSGVTAGCGGGNFCPDDPITRAEMAVFLAKALGLHWPS